MEKVISPTTVYIVEDSALIRERLVEMVDAMPDAVVVGEATSAPAAIDGIARLRPDCVVLDLQLLNSTGLAVLRAVHPQMPDVAFIVLTNHASTPYCRLCIAEGARYFFDKSTDFARVRDAISDVATPAREHLPG